MSCRFSQHDGSYVLGSLSPADRRAFEEHLSTCPDCSRAVGELAGLPGLLGRVPADVLDAAPGRDPAPDVLPALLRAVRRDRTRRTTFVAGLAAAAAAVVLGGSVLALDALDDPPQEQASQQVDQGREMTRVGTVPMSASLTVTSVEWGTRLDLACSYSSPGRYPADEDWRLELVVHSEDGGTEKVASWHARPGQDMQLTAATAVEADQITSVEVQTAAGDAVMRQRVHSSAR